MPLPMPTLDRLSYDELVSEARSSMPALAPGWTDYNAHDPGITLLELFAWLAEGASYRLDNIPEASYRAFLRLAGVVQKQAQVAQTLLVFKPVAGALSLANCARVQSQDGRVVFQTTAALFVSDAKLQAVVSESGATFDDLTGRNKSMISLFLPFGAKPQPGDALYLGFDRVLAPADSVVSLGVWTGNAFEDMATRAQLSAEQNAVEDEVIRLCTDFPPNRANWHRHYSVHTIWEYYTGNGQWQVLQDVVDDTRALTLSGTVQFKSPATDTHKYGGVSPPTYDGKFFIRCRLERGVYDCPPRIAYVALNGVTARHAVDAPLQTFLSTGRAAQSVELDKEPVVPDRTQLTVTLNGVAEGRWHVTSTWDGVGAHEHACMLNAEAGTVVFGDGRIGRVPPAGSQIEIEYQTGGGAGGNVVAGTLVQFEPVRNDLKVEQPFAACGGAAAETLNEAQARAVRELATTTRAATLQDYEMLALATPGVQIARAHAIADYHPDMPCLPVSGSTTVVVLPPCPEHKPVPTAALLTTVQRYLERRRVLTGEIHVVPPHYTTVAVSARLFARPEVDRRALMRQARNALEQFFHPLHGGPEGQGWPIGRAVYRAELLALLNDLEGVLYVEEISWRVDGKPAIRCANNNITVCRHGLVASGIHEITINEGSACHE